MCICLLVIAVGSTVKTTELKTLFSETVRIQCLESIGIAFVILGPLALQIPYEKHGE